jgi:acyl-CoA thioesterase
VTPDAAQQLAERIVRRMLANDALSRWLGLEVVEIGPERSTCRMVVRPEMVNGFGVAHGGIVFSLADSAFAFACNTHGRVTVSIENAITYPQAVHTGDMLTARARQDAASNRLSYYTVEVRNQTEDLVALFRGTAYKTEKQHFPDSEGPDA